MGIKSGFGKFLEKTAPNSLEHISLAELAFNKIAIDLSLYLNKFKAIKGPDWLEMFVKMIVNLRRNHVHCVYIFDGVAPVEKTQEQLQRRKDREEYEKRLAELIKDLNDYEITGNISQNMINMLKKRKNSPPRLLSKVKPKEVTVDIEWLNEKCRQMEGQMYKLSAEDFEMVKELFSIMGVPYYTAPGEAELMCADLCKKGLVDAVLTEDTDVIAYGAPICLSKLDNFLGGTCRKIEVKSLYKDLDMSPEQFLDFCIMCGTDYNKNITGIGSKTAFKHIKTFITIENFIKNVRPKPSQDFSVLNYEKSRELFTSSCPHKIDYIPFSKRPNFDKLCLFCKNHKISIDIMSIKKEYNERANVKFN